MRISSRCALAVAIGLGLTGTAISAPVKSPLGSVPPGHAKGVVLVRFVEGTEGLPDHLLTSVQDIRPLFSLPKVRLDEMRGRGKARVRELRAAGRSLPFEEVPDLSLWFRITLKQGVDQADFVNALQFVSSVDVVELEPLPSPAPFTGTTPNFTGQQGYLDPATEGIDAEYSWTVPGGSAAGVKIYDVEYSWNQNHEDLDTAAGVPLLLDGGDAAVDPFNDSNHGTAVLSVMSATDDTIGVTGISFGGDIGLAPANTMNLGYNPANAIALAAADGKPGDAILIEQQTGVCGLVPSCGANQTNCGPVEWSGPVFAAIQSAVALGITVLEAAGNGGVDLDQSACGDYFNRSFRNSGAIIVGAGGSPGSGSDRQRLAFSSFGSRVDLQGWGNSVMAAGYGEFVDDNDPANANRRYTSGFSGTSSSSAIVTGAVANLQGVAVATGGGQLLSPAEVRDILVATGSPQQGDTSTHIGPRPNLLRAIAEIIGVQVSTTTTSTSTSSTTSTSPGCSNGAIDPGEECGEPGLSDCATGQLCVECSCRVRGDCNVSGAIDLFDVLTEIDLVLGRFAPTPTQVIVCSGDCDSDIDLFDVLIGIDVVLGRRSLPLVCS
jgi:hypothetical protein